MTNDFAGWRNLVGNLDGRYFPVANVSTQFVHRVLGCRVCATGPNFLQVASLVTEAPAFTFARSRSLSPYWFCVLLAAAAEARINSGHSDLLTFAPLTLTEVRAGRGSLINAARKDGWLANSRQERRLAMEYQGWRHGAQEWGLLMVTPGTQDWQLNPIYFSKPDLLWEIARHAPVRSLTAV